MYILEKYYTDEHDVDENMVTILLQGGSWGYDISAGIVHRNLYDASTNSGGHVASRLKK